MATTNRRQLTALKNLLRQVDHTLATTPPLPENRTGASRELLSAALAITDDLLAQEKLPAAALLGAKGGSVTAKRGSDYFRKLAARRKHHRGGRPPKESA